MSNAHGLTPETCRIIHETLTHFPEVEQALLFGSRAKGTFRSGSDIDLALSGPLLDLGRVGQIDRAFDDTPLPYRFSLVIDNEHTDASSAGEIRRFGVLFYERFKSPVPHP